MKTELQKKRSKLFWLSVLMYFLSVAPMAIPIIVNIKHYTADSLKLSGLVMFLAVIICLVALKDKFGNFLKSNGQLKLTIILLLFIELTKYISKDVEVLLIFSAVGAILALIPQYFVNRLKRIVDKEETAGINASYMGEMLKRNSDNDTGGRV